MNEERPMSNPLRIERIVLKDLSLETPMGQDIFTAEWQPDIKVRLDLRSQRLADGCHEVVLTATATALAEGGGTAFVIEAQQAGVFNVAGFEGEGLRRALAIDAPRLIFPYLREAVDSVATKGGFPPVGMQPPDFEAWHDGAHRPASPPPEA